MSSDLTKKDRMSAAPSWSCRGIEPAAEIGLTCRNADPDDAGDAKRSAGTCGYATGVDGVNTQPSDQPPWNERPITPPPV